MNIHQRKLLSVHKICLSNRKTYLLAHCLNFTSVNVGYWFFCFISYFYSYTCGDFYLVNDFHQSFFFVAYLSSVLNEKVGGTMTIVTRLYYYVVCVDLYSFCHVRETPLSNTLQSS